jgi:uncharacterized membrane protein
MQEHNPRRRLALRLNVWVLRLTRRWLRVALIVIGLYVSLPFLAPTFMKLGLTGPAGVIYFLYSPFCHQFAFRSFFLFGEQVVYPRYNADTSLIPFESYVASLPEFSADRVTPWGKVGDLYAFNPGFEWAAREFVGDQQMGYKVSLCERDIAIWGGMFVGGLLYTRVRRRLRPVPIWLYFLLGLAPIGIDGFSQLLGYPPFNFWSPRETMPAFRVLTGALFGLMNIWLGFPYLEMSMRETRRELEAKLARVGISF